MYHEGKGVPQDSAEAVRWYRKAAEQGGALRQAGQFALGYMYLIGEGVPQDPVLTHKWFNLAAAAGGKSDFGTGASFLRDLVAKHLTAAQLAEAQRLAREWR